MSVDVYAELQNILKPAYDQLDYMLKAVRDEWEKSDSTPGIVRGRW